MSGGPSLPLGWGFFVKFPTYAGSDYVTTYRFMDDPGRYETMQNEADKHRWRVPTLRNLEYTAPYFHDGAVKSVEEAVKVMAKTQLDKELIAGQVADLTAFMTALTGEFPQQTMPRLPPTPGDLLE